MVDTQNIQESAKGLGKKQKQFIKALFVSPLPISQLKTSDNLVSSLIERGLVKEENGHFCLSELGKNVYQYFKGEFTEITANQFEKTTDINKQSKLEIKRQKRLDKSNEYLELYKIGFSYQQIGDHYKVTRERVRQVLNSNPAFKEYLEEREQENAATEKAKQEQAKAELYARSLAALYPKQVAELWDYEKNGDLKPEDIPAGSQNKLGKKRNKWLSHLCRKDKKSRKTTETDRDLSRIC